MGLAASSLPFFPQQLWGLDISSNDLYTTMFIPEDLSIIGNYGTWASNLLPEIPALSYRKDGWESVETWRKKAKERFMEHLAMPEITTTPDVNVDKTYTYDGLHIEELSWQYPMEIPPKPFFLNLIMPPLLFLASWPFTILEEINILAGEKLPAPLRRCIRSWKNINPTTTKAEPGPMS